jgi:inward rectifier potassium channel
LARKKPKAYDPGIDVIHAPRDLFGDLYHSLLEAPWSVVLGGIAALVLAVNVIFACVYLATGGVVNARAGSFADAFFFSVQTVGTIGYGYMYPQSTGAQLAVTAESIVALLVTALATGLVFAKFSIPQARLEFAENAVIFKNDGVLTLAIRLANTRGNYIVEANCRVTLGRAETTKEGVIFWRLYDLRLLRERSPALGRSWQVMHLIGDDSPLRGATQESLAAAEAEMIVSLTGIDGTSSQTVHGRYVYEAKDLRFGFRFTDMIRPKGDGRYELDYAKLHEVTPAEL